MVRAKSGMSFEREMRRRRKITLYGSKYVSKCFSLCLFGGKTHVSKLFNIHTNPKIHPMVVSPLKASQLRTRSSENAVPYTSVVNRMSPVAVT